MNILITVCARGGSKGIKDKNIIELAGKPLIYHTIDLAKSWGKAKRIVCSTDSEKIAAVAKERGIDVPFTRPKELASDTAGKLPVIKHALEECRRIFKEDYDLIMDLDVTSPIRKIQDLDSCIRILKETSADVVFSVTEARRNPYFNMVELDENGFARLSKNKEVVRRQDAPKVYDMNASIYVYKKQFFDQEPTKANFFNRAAVHVMDPKSAFDIDNELDFRFIEFLAGQGEIRI